MSTKLFAWTSEQVEILTQNFQAGASYDAIGRELGISRNAVAGKVRRLGLSRVPKVVVVKVDALKVNAARKRARKVNAPTPIRTPGLVSLLELTKGQCRDVADQRDAEGRPMYCGDPTVAGSSYCAFHHQLYQRPREKRTTDGQASEHQQRL